MNDAKAINAETSRQIREELGLPPRRTQTLYDEKCYELAEHFLPPDASHEQKDELAGWIQYQVELWFTPTDEPGEPAIDPQSSANEGVKP